LKCPIENCNKDFTQKKNLNKHLAEHSVKNMQNLHNYNNFTTNAFRIEKLFSFEIIQERKYLTDYSRLISLDEQEDHTSDRYFLINSIIDCKMEFLKLNDINDVVNKESENDSFFLYHIKS
jgi:hypothetical protein